MKKITTGFVIQNYDDNGKCTGQEFIAGDQVDWEDDDGEPINEMIEHEYFPYEMVQPE